MNKILEALQQKFPSISRAQLRNKVREISDFNFTENRWQVSYQVVHYSHELVTDEMRCANLNGNYLVM